jgi:fermentation-respiration switch protein FrsA (DUF1100 family)
MHSLFLYIVYCVNGFVTRGGQDDLIVLPHHSEDLLKKCGSSVKKLVSFAGDHNSIRDDIFFSSLSVHNLQISTLTFVVAFYEEASAFLFQHMLDDRLKCMISHGCMCA